MVRFSPTDAVFAGFRFVKERPATILVWAAYLLVVLTVAFVAMLDIGGDSLTSLMIAAQGANPNPNQLMKLMEEVAPASNMQAPSCAWRASVTSTTTAHRGPSGR